VPFGGAHHARGDNAADRERQGLAFDARAFARPPLVHSPWSWRPVVLACNAYRGSRLAKR
jgi:hypothetical protein